MTGMLVVLTLVSSCEDFISVPDPETGISSKGVFDTDETAIATLTGIYGQLITSNSFANGELAFMIGVYSDELISYSQSPETSSFYFNTVSPTSTFLSELWAKCYNSILSTNLIIEGLQNENGVSPSMQKQLMGEALFLRAFCHFYLVNLFGDVPLIKTSDYRANTNVSRTPSTSVYEGIVADLIEAVTLLPDAYPSAGRVRANKGAAIALLARAYLYTGDFINAEIQASQIINKTAQYKLHKNLDIVFLKTSEEAVWQLMPQADLYTYEGSRFIIVAAPPPFVALRSSLYSVFEPGDLRKTRWTNSFTSESGHSTWYYAFKYKENSVNGTGAEYSMVLRLAEQYLIRAEARVRQDKLPEAQADIDVIRSRAGLESTTASTADELLAAIEHERRVELFTEWGHRFFDLKRRGRLDEVLGPPIKPNWSSHHAFLPLPQSEIFSNRNLTQNTGY